MPNKYDIMRQDFRKFALKSLDESLTKDVKKSKENNIRKIKDKIVKLPWDINKKLNQSHNGFSGFIAGKKVEFAFNEDYELITKIDDQISNFDSVNFLRNKVDTGDKLISALYSYLEEEVVDNANSGNTNDNSNNNDDESNKKDAIDEADEVLSKINLNDLSKDAKMQLIEDIVDNLQDNCEKDEFDDIMNEIYDLLDDYYVKDEDNKTEENNNEPAPSPSPAPATEQTPAATANESPQVTNKPAV